MHATTHQAKQRGSVQGLALERTHRRQVFSVQSDTRAHRAPKIHRPTTARRAARRFLVDARRVLRRRVRRHRSEPTRSSVRRPSSPLHLETDRVDDEILGAPVASCPRRRVLRARHAWSPRRRSPRERQRVVQVQRARELPTKPTAADARSSRRVDDRASRYTPPRPEPPRRSPRTRRLPVRTRASPPPPRRTPPPRSETTPRRRVRLAPVDHALANVVAAAVHANVNETIHRVAATAAPFPSARSASRHRVEAQSRQHSARRRRLRTAAATTRNDAPFAADAAATKAAAA